MGMAKVTRNYQLTLPKDARRRFNIRVGDTLLVSEREGKEEMVIRKLSANVVEDTFGAWGKGEDSVKFVRSTRIEAEKARAKKLGI